MRSGGYRPRTTAGKGRRRWLIVIATVAVVLVIGWIAVPPLVGGLFRSLAEANPDLMRFGPVQDAVAAVMDDRPDTPAGTDETPVEFVIEQGASSGEITENLVARDLVTDRLAFSYVLASEGTYDDLRFGRHMLNRAMTPRRGRRRACRRSGDRHRRCGGRPSPGTSPGADRRLPADAAIHQPRHRGVLHAGQRPAAGHAREVRLAGGHSRRPQRRGLPGLGRVRGPARRRCPGDARCAPPALAGQPGIRR